jgi:hypothetical protein
MTGHATMLVAKHAGLEAKISAELARPAPDDALLHELKKQKLRLKDELARTTH